MNDHNPLLQAGEHLDRLGYQGLSMIQNPSKFKFTMDAFLLTGFVTPKADEKLIDLGTGSGVLALLLAGQDGVRQVVGVEIQPELAELARRNVLLNQLETKITIVEADLRELPEHISPNSFHWVIANPPYFPVASGVVSGNAALAQAKFELTCNLDDLLRAMSRLVKGNGRVSLIYPTERLATLLTKLEQHHLTPKRLCLIHSYTHSASNLCLVEARPGAKAGVTVLPPVFIYQAEGVYSESMNQIFLGKKF